MSRIGLKEISDKVYDLPVLPQVIEKVINLTEDSESTIHDIEETVMLDQSLTSKVLRLANSAYYGFPRRIKTISEATILLGFEAIKGIVLAASVSKMLLKSFPGYGLEPEDLWRHSQATAITARYLAQYKKKENLEQYYIAGLLHDIGKVVLSHYMEDNFREVLAIVEREQIPFIEGEKRVLGFHHGQIGSIVAQKWNFPSDLVEAIGFHHRPQLAREDLELTSAVHIADGIVRMLGIGLGVDGLAYTFDPQAMKNLAVTDEDLEQLMAEIADIFSDEDCFRI